MPEEETTIDEEYCKTHNEDKSMYEKPLGKLLLTIITVYSFLIAILALTYDKDIFFFLPVSTIIIGLDCAYLFYIVVSANLNYFGEKLPKIVKSNLEGYSLNIIIIIVCWFSLSFLYEIYFVKESVSRPWLIVLFIISQIIFGVPIIISQLRATLHSLSALYFKNKKIYQSIQSVRVWLNKYNKQTIFLIFLFHMTFTSFNFVILMGTSCSIIFLDWFFFGELCITLILPLGLYTIINFCSWCKNKCKSKKEKRELLGED